MNTRGFTLIEVAAVLALLGAGAASIVVMSNAGAQPTFGKPKEKDGAEPAPPKPAGGSLLEAQLRARSSARQLKCSTQVRGFGQALVVWGSNNDGFYPLPSMFDTADATVAEKGRAKDTSGNIVSILIWNGNVSPEISVCPDESNTSIKRYANYSYSDPKTAIKPQSAQWDPSFNADFTKGTGHLSYAHLQPSGDIDAADPKAANVKRTGRLLAWSDTFSTTEAVFGDRSPEIESVTVAGDGSKAAQYTVKPKIADSKTLKIHGAPDSWEGNVVYNDNHVSFETTLRPNPTKDTTWAKYTTKEGSKRLDTHWYDEPDDKDATNLFLGIFTAAGKDPKDFRGIWD